MDLWTKGWGGVGWDEVREWHGHVCTTKCKVDGWWRAAAWRREISSVLCDRLEGWEGGDMGIYIYIYIYV